ncbi:MAG TPA: acyltransferase family protein [Gemmatimonadaceae bacterium]|nr:acyltransferase family protein [Gemmatimonadaceae bacterium]
MTSVLTQGREGTTSPFRADIEGLRAVAVLLVVGYHARAPYLTGGYVGVDVFFVLSGYLITGLLADEVGRSGTISLRRFYARRARRLLPGAALMIAATLAASLVVLTPLERIRLSSTALATVVYASNLWFYRADSDYFAPDTHSNPLLHTWSLGVEEQFYFVWPLVVLAVFRFASDRYLRNRRPLAIVIGAASILSLLLCIRLTQTQQPLAFFASPTRAWEFGLGGLAALVGVPSGDIARRARLTSGVLSWSGLAVVVGSAFTFTRFTSFPGSVALVPVLGTVAVLIAGRPDVVSGAGRLLAIAPLQQIGRLSYSWYLWHWPALVFLEIAVPSASPLMRGACALGSLAVAWVAYRAVENPIRRHGSLDARPLTTLLGAMVLMIVCVGGATGVRALARVAVERPAQARLAAGTASGPFYERGCLTSWGDAQLRVCELGDTTGNAAASIVLLGDSHAASWLPALERAATTHRWRVTTLIKVSCPSADLSFYNSHLRRTEHECESWRSAALEWIAAHRPDVVVLANMASYVAVLDRDGWQYQHSVAEWRDGLRRTFARLDALGVHTLWLRATPMMRFDVPECLARAAEHRWYSDSHCGRPRGEALSDELWAADREAARGLSTVRLADLSSCFCDETTCAPVRDGEVLYRDTNHITVSYAQSLAPVLSSLLEASLVRR